MLLGRNTVGTVAYLGGVMALPEPFVKSWTDMLQYNYEYLLDANQRIEYTRSTVSYHSFARNMLVEHMKGDWLLQLDTDATFDPDLLGRMLLWFNNAKPEGKQIDVLAGMYLYKSDPHPPVVYGYDPKKKEKIIIGDWGKGDLLRIKGAGAGCLLIRRSVFDKIRSETGQSPFDIYFDGEAPLSEDHSFFERCWNLDIPVYAHTDIWVNHLTYKPLTQKDYDRSIVKVEKIKKFW